MTLLQGSLLFGSAVVAGMINSVAGGGTLVSFPTLVWTGVSPIMANATNTLAMVPGAWAGLWGYRDEMHETPKHYVYLLIPSLVGGVIGAVLLQRTPDKTFARLVPFLVLFATILFIVQGPIQRWLKSGPASEQIKAGVTTEVEAGAVTTRWLIGVSFYQLLIAIYGGYFGAGIGILMLAGLGIIGLTNIHQMNGLKNLFASTINAIAAFYFIAAGLIEWHSAGLMCLGSIIGGYGAAGLARGLGQKVVRRTVIVIGLAMAVSLFFKR
ncbi:MAG: sulfite exporter TauE/SafE family protein [Acidobacteriota bacterium]